MTRLDEPHKRLTRTTRRNLTRLAFSPLGAAWLAVTLAGFTQPHRLGNPPTAPRSAVSTGTSAGMPLPTVDVCTPDSLLPVCRYGGGQ